MLCPNVLHHCLHTEKQITWFGAIDLRNIEHILKRKSNITLHGHSWIPITLLYTHEYYPFKKKDVFATLREITNIELAYSKAHQHVTFCPFFLDFALLIMQWQCLHRFVKNPQLKCDRHYQWFCIAWNPLDRWRNVNTSFSQIEKHEHRISLCS